MGKLDKQVLLAAYSAVIILDFILAATITIGYTVLAPWHKYSAGRQIAGLLGSLTLLFGVSVVRIFARDFPFYGELLLLMLIVLTIAIGFVGWGIYSAQMRHYWKVRTLKKHRTTIQNRHNMAGGNSPEVNDNGSDRRISDR